MLEPCLSANTPGATFGEPAPPLIPAAETPPVPLLPGAPTPVPLVLPLPALLPLVMRSSLPSVLAFLRFEKAAIDDAIDSCWTN